MASNWPDTRSPEAQVYRRLYGLAKWKRTRKAQLDKQPLCETCLKHGRYTPATVCDHVDPKTKLDPATFFLGPFQSLCDAEPWRCHSSIKQSEELRGYVKGNDTNGRPIDANHPWNRRQ